MKKLEIMNLIDDKYVNEANPENKRKKKKFNLMKFGVIAACICLMVTALNLYLFIPFKAQMPDVSQYEDSEYFPIIEKINAMAAVTPKYKNNFNKIMSALSSVGKKVDLDGGDIMEDFVNGAPSANPDYDASPENGNKDEGYKEITDNQVEGVTEGDIIKRSDRYIYYLSYGVLKIYSIEGKDSKAVGSIDLSSVVITNEYGKEEEINLYSYNCEMYLSKDCKTVTVLGIDGGKTRVISFDVSNPEKIALKNHIQVDGNYKTSRLVDGKLLLITNKYYMSKDIDFSKAETFVPSISYDNESKTMLIPMESIVLPDEITNQNYTVITLMDESTLGITGCASFLSYTSDVYVTNNAIYAPHSSTKSSDNTRKSVTEIACISFKDGSFDVKGKITVDGYIKDRYSLDEFNGILRVVTTTESFTTKKYSFSGNESFMMSTSGGTSASLYCIDLAKWEVVASVCEFAPKGETVRSVRFDKSYAYVCTAVQLTDPVFFFDLSDVNNITYKETGNIEGFSTSLINLGNGFLLGIGRGDDWNTVKVEVYREGENKVESVCSYAIENASYSVNYKSYYINRDKQLFGFGYYNYASYSGVKNNYVLLLFANGELLELVNTPINGQVDTMRSVYIDGYIYIFGDNDFKVIKL